MEIMDNSLFDICKKYILSSKIQQLPKNLNEMDQTLDAKDFAFLGESP